MTRPGAQDEDTSRQLSQRPVVDKGYLSSNFQAFFQGTVLQTVEVGKSAWKFCSCQSIQSILNGDKAAVCRGQVVKLRRQAWGLMWVTSGE